MQRPYLEKLGILEIMVTNIYCRFSKSFILMVVDDLGPNNMQALSFFLKFYAQYNHLIELYSTSKPITTFVKNVTSVVYVKQ
jgi:hypothetical protein